MIIAVPRPAATLLNDIRSNQVLAGQVNMFNHFVPTKKLAAVVATLGLAGVAGVCGCKTSHKEPGCCQVCAPVSAPHTEAPAPPNPEPTGPNTANTNEPHPAPAAPEAIAPAPYEEPTPTAAETAARFEALGGVVELDAAQDITVLDLSGTKTGDDELRGGAALDQLKQLDLSNTNITDAAIADPSWMSNLTRLSLNGTSITDAGLKSFENLPRLQLLWMNETAIGDAGLSHIQGLTGLQSLGLNKTEVTDEGLAHIRNMRDLKYLLLGHTQITDAGLQHLRGLTNLKGLSLVGTRVTPVGIAELQTALPDCRIVADRVEDSAEGDAEETGETEQDTSSIPQPLKLDGLKARPAVSRSSLRSSAPWRRSGFAFGDSTVRKTAAKDTTGDISRYHIAVALAEAGNMRAALPMFVETVGEAAAYYNIGVLLCKAGHWEQGEAQFRTALELDPGMTAAQSWLREIELERATILPVADEPAELQPIQKTNLLRPIHVQSDRRTDMIPPPIGVWTHQ